MNVPALRLANQCITRPAQSPVDAVRALVATQAQDYLGSLWAIGLRSKSTEAEVETALAHKQIVRSWPLRGTIHTVAAAELRPLLAHLAPAILKRNVRRFRELELGGDDLKQAEKALRQDLKNGPVGRTELMRKLDERGISTQGQRGYHILWALAQQAVLCYGPRRGKEQTFVLLDDWIPDQPPTDREETLQDLAARYFAGHGPATERDFRWWSGLNAADSRKAVSHLDSADGLYGGRKGAADKAVYLLPPFDEYLLGYGDRSHVLEKTHANHVAPGANGMFKPLIVIAGQVRGVWSRKLQRGKVQVNFEPFAPFSPSEIAELQCRAQSYADFLGLQLDSQA